VLTFRLDRHSPIPLYYQLQQQLREAIETGRLPANSALPTEPELANQVGVSRFTVRQAMEQLVRDGLIRRERGRGTFISDPRTATAAAPPYSFAQDLASQGLDRDAPVLRVTAVIPPDEVRHALSLADHEAALEIVRLRSRGGQPAAVETSFLPAALVPGLERDTLARTSLYDVLDRRYGVRVTSAEEELRHVALDATVAQELGVAGGTAGFQILRRTYADGRLVELRYSHLPSESAHFRVSLASLDAR
jgi:GntR family transcriptional regulator